MHLEVATHRLIGLVNRAEITWAAAVIRNERRCSAGGGAGHFGDYAAERGASAGIPQVPLIVAVVRLIIRMLPAGADERADDGELVGHRGELRKMLADLHAADVRGNRLEQAAELGGGIWLQVENV